MNRREKIEALIAGIAGLVIVLGLLILWAMLETMATNPNL